MNGRYLLVAVMVALAACAVPTVEMDLPDRPGVADTPARVPPTAPVDDPASSTAPGVERGVVSASPGPAELDELDQLIRDIESLLEGVSEELEQITFEEEGE